MAWVQIMPGYEAIFRERGWDSAAPFLAWTGLLVNRHRARQVERVTSDAACGLALGQRHPSAKPQAASFYLKKQFAVTWSERFRNAWDGFGWCSTAAREAQLLRALHAAGVGCAEVAAVGERDQQAFVLLGDRSDMTELRVFLQQLPCEEDGHRLADALGQELARLHDAGFEHPDLFAKHILAARAGGSFRFCVLDWQRGRRRHRVSWWLRCRDLALLDATLNEVLASDRLRLRCLAAYWRASNAHERRPNLRRLAQRIRQDATSLRHKRAIREIGQLPVPASQQQFVSLNEGRLLVTRSHYEEHRGRLPPWLTRWVDEPAALDDDATGERLRVRTWEAATVPALPWPLPPLAHVLFRLHRFGVPAPRLLAAAQSSSRGLLLLSQAETIAFEEGLAQAPAWLRPYLLEQAGWIIRQIHDAGYRLATDAGWTHALGVDPGSGEVMLDDMDSLEDTAADWRHLAQAELPTLAHLGSRTDRLRFLRGYMQKRLWTDEQHRWIRTLMHQDGRRSERQVVS